MISTFDARGAGVTSYTQGQQGGARSVKTVTQLTPMQMFAAEVWDEDGQKHTTVVFRVGDQFYHDPNGEKWTAALRPVSKDSWLGKQLLSKSEGLKPVTDIPGVRRDDVQVIDAPSPR